MALLPTDKCKVGYKYTPSSQVSMLQGGLSVQVGYREQLAHQLEA